MSIMSCRSFFLFKQKTADEMRISDWSSDVCSSDLDPLPSMKKGPRMHLKGKTALVTGSTSGIGLGIAKALAGHGAAVIINGFGDADAIEAERAALAALNDGKAAYDGADQIGRASCRERVCQYV